MAGEKQQKSTAQIVERELHPISGFLALAGILAGLILSLAGIYFGYRISQSTYEMGIVICVIFVVLFVVLCFLPAGLKVVGPKEALVMTLFGKYYGTIRHAGFFFVNPFATAVNPGAKSMGISTGKGEKSGGKRISLKTRTLSNDKQKVNDSLGNPVIIGVVVIWHVSDPTKAVFEVQNYANFLSIQCDAVIRNTARLYPYDVFDEEIRDEERTLRGSVQEIADIMKAELVKKVASAGLTVNEVRITHLSYAEEIAAAMLQRQQAVALIAARQKIVEGAVGMVKMAIEQLGEEEVVVLDEERKAAMVSNLLVVLCGNKDAQPVVNSGSIYG